MTEHEAAAADVSAETKEAEAAPEKIVQENKENSENENDQEKSGADVAPVGADSTKETVNKSEEGEDQEGGEEDKSPEAAEEATPKKAEKKKSMLGKLFSKKRTEAGSSTTGESDMPRESDATGEAKPSEGDTPREGETPNKTVARKTSLKDRIKRPFSKKKTASPVVPAVAETEDGDDKPVDEEPEKREEEKKDEEEKPTEEKAPCEEEKAKDEPDVPESSGVEKEAAAATANGIQDANEDEEKPEEESPKAAVESGGVVPPLKTAELGRSRSSIDDDSNLFAGTSANIAAELKAHGVSPSPRTPRQASSKMSPKSLSRKTPPIPQAEEEEEGKEVADVELIVDKVVVGEKADETQPSEEQPEKTGDDAEAVAGKDEQEGEEEEKKPRRKKVVRQPSLVTKIFTFGRARAVEVEVDEDAEEGEGAKDYGHGLKEEDVEKLKESLIAALAEEQMDTAPLSEKSVKEADSAADFFISMKPDLEMDAGDSYIRLFLAKQLGEDHGLIEEMEQKEKEQEITEIDAYLKKRIGEKADKIFTKEHSDFETAEEYYKFLQSEAQEQGFSLLSNLKLKLGKDHPYVKAVEASKGVDEEEKGEEEEGEDTAKPEASEDAAKQEAKSQAEGGKLEDTAIIGSAELPISEGGVVSDDAVAGKVKERGIKGAMARDESGEEAGGCACLCFGRA